MKILLFNLVIVILLISLVSATDATLPPVKSGDCFIIQESCSNCTYVNVTSVKYPNSTIRQLNYVMTNYGGTSWFNNTFCDSNDTGIYIFGVKGNPDGVTDSEFIRIDVNPTGIEATGQRTTATTVAIFAIMIISVLFFFAFMYFQHPSAKYSFIVMSGIFFIVAINLILNSLTNEVVDPKIISLFDFIGAASYYFYWLGGGLLCIILFLTVFTNIYEKYRKVRFDKYGGQNG